MRTYSLYNKRLHKNLTHPRVGMWYTSDLAEAESMLAACRGYVDTLNVEGYQSAFVIVDAVTGEEILSCQHLSGVDSVS